MSTAIVRELRKSGEQARRLVLFSDSRQDAAKLSAGLEKRHYQDLLREVMVRELIESTSGSTPAARSRGSLEISPIGRVLRGAMFDRGFLTSTML